MGAGSADAGRAYRVRPGRVPIPVPLPDPSTGYCLRGRRGRRRRRAPRRVPHRRGGGGGGWMPSTLPSA